MDVGTYESAELWRGQSEYVAALLQVGRADRTRWLIRTGEILFATCGALTVSGIVSDFGDVLYPLAGATGLAAYAFLCKWVARQRPPRSRFVRLAERVRRIMAYEGDPGDSLH